MRKSKIINIEGRGEVTIKEVSPYAVYSAWASSDRIKSLEAMAADALSPDLAEIKTWYASEIEAVIAGFMEVNNSFFAIARSLQMDGLLGEVTKTLSQNLPVVFADSFRKAMQTPGTTDGPFS